jgi:hypothetical protein
VAALLLGSLLLSSSLVPARAAGWHDYSLEIATGFSVHRMNSFDICLGTPGGALLICPQDHPGRVGPLVDYAVTQDLILTRHLGVRPHEKNPSLPQGDPGAELFFIVLRGTHDVVGPLERDEFQGHPLHPGSGLDWIPPANPSSWRPLLGDLLFLALGSLYLGWPLLLLACGILAFWLFVRRRSGRSHDAAA